MYTYIRACPYKESLFFIYYMNQFHNTLIAKKIRTFILSGVSLESRRLLSAGSYSSLLDTKEGRLKPTFAANVDIPFARAGSQRGFFSRRSHPPIFQAIIFTLLNRIITIILIVLFGFTTQISNYEIHSVNSFLH